MTSRLSSSTGLLLALLLWSWLGGSPCFTKGLQLDETEKSCAVSKNFPLDLVVLVLSAVTVLLQVVLVIDLWRCQKVQGQNNRNDGHIYEEPDLILRPHLYYPTKKGRVNNESFYEVPKI